MSTQWNRIWQALLDGREVPGLTREEMNRAGSEAQAMDPPRRIRSHESSLGHGYRVVIVGPAVTVSNHTIREFE